MPERTVDIIGDAAFCVMLLSRTVPEGGPVDWYDDTLTKTRRHVLRNMTGMESISLPKVTALGAYAFMDCVNLKSANLPMITMIPERAFFNCPALEEIYAPLATSIGEFSVNSTSLKKIELPAVTTTNASSLCFYGCSALEEVILPRITYIGNSSFYGCSSLKQIDLPSIISIGANVMNACANLEVVNLGPNLTGIHSNAFAGTPDGLVINMPIAEGVISGAPWGAPNAVINYEVEYSGKVTMPTTN